MDEPDRMGDEAVRAAFDECVARSDPAMIAVLAEAGGAVDACLVGFHCQCSIEPAQYAVWISQENRTFGLASAARTLTVHFLDADQHDLAARLGGVTLDEDPSKLERVEVVRDSSGALRIAACHQWFVGAVVDIVPAADHTAFVLEPLAAAAADGEPLRLSRVEDVTPGHPVNGHPVDDGW